MKRWIAGVFACIVTSISFAPTALAIDESHLASRKEMIDKAIAYLRSQQDKESGGWSVPKAGTPQPHMPAITALVLSGMMMEPGITENDQAVRDGVAYILKFRKGDGGIYDAMVPSYNTAIALSLLARCTSPEAQAAIGPAQQFLRNSQWGSITPVGMGGPGGKEAPVIDGKPIDKDHPFYGGLGYGSSGRPDLSNLSFMLQGLHDSGVPGDDPAMQRAIVFLQRCQMVEEVKTPDGKVFRINDQPYAKGSHQGGFIYATGANTKAAGQGQSMAGSFEETLDDGTKASRLRAYGSMSYAGFKSYIYAGLTPSDPRVAAALEWMKDNYSLDENPGIGVNGFYYYVLTFARALSASKLDRLDVTGFAEWKQTVYLSPLPAGASEDSVRELISPVAKVKAVTLVADPTSGKPRSGAMVRLAEEAKVAEAIKALNGTEWQGVHLNVNATGPAQGSKTRDWRADLIEKLATLQKPDGSFQSLDERWMESNPVLITAYAVIALQNAAH